MIWKIEFMLGGYFPGSRTLEDSDFIQHLDVGSHPVIRNPPLGGTCRITLVDVTYDSKQDPVSASEDFEKRLSVQLIAMRDWLASHGVEVFRKFSASGLKVILFCIATMDQDQFDLVLPASLLYEIGIRDVPLQIYTNE